MPDLTLRIGDHLGESSVHLTNLLGGGRLTDSRADQRVSEPHAIVGDLDPVPINSGLERFKALSTGSRDLVERRSAVKPCREEGGPRVRAKGAQPACESALAPIRQGRGGGRKLLARSPHTPPQLNHHHAVAPPFS